MSQIAETAVARGDVAESEVKTRDLIGDEVIKPVKITTEEGEEASDDKEVTLQPRNFSKSESPIKNSEENVESTKSQSPAKDSAADETDVKRKDQGQSPPKIEDHEDEGSRGNLESSADSPKDRQDKDEADSDNRKQENTESDSVDQKLECTESEKSTEPDDRSRKCTSSNECSGKYHSTLSSEEGCSEKCHSVQSTVLGDSDLQKEELKQTIDSENAAVSPASWKPFRSFRLQYQNYEHLICILCLNIINLFAFFIIG